MTQLTENNKVQVATACIRFKYKTTKTRGWHLRAKGKQKTNTQNFEVFLPLTRLGGWYSDHPLWTWQNSSLQIHHLQCAGQRSLGPCFLLEIMAELLRLLVPKNTNPQKTCLSSKLTIRKAVKAVFAWTTQKLCFRLATREMLTQLWFHHSTQHL